MEITEREIKSTSSSYYVERHNKSSQKSKLDIESTQSNSTSVFDNLYAENNIKFDFFTDTSYFRVFTPLEKNLVGEKLFNFIDYIDKLDQFDWKNEIPPSEKVKNTFSRLFNLMKLDFDLLEKLKAYKLKFGYIPDGGLGFEIFMNDDNKLIFDYYNESELGELHIKRNGMYIKELEFNYENVYEKTKDAFCLSR
ncbi:hypothetical protein GC194_10385 [bacterium]|nr:hypothetical protein [bacterium]